MKQPIAKRHAAKPDLSGLSRVLPRIQSLIEASRQHVVSTANLTLVWLTGMSGASSQDIQQNQKRAGWRAVAGGSRGQAHQHVWAGFSRPNLQDMRRFFEGFEICSAAPSKSFAAQILQALPVEFLPDIRQALPAKSSAKAICSAVPSKSSGTEILPAAMAESEDRPVIDFSRHHRLGWTHYRILLGVEAGLKRGFYFEQAAQQRWATRELQRQIDRALFERVALSRDTRALVRLEKKSGPVETVRYEDAFKDPYLLDFLGLKGSYSERTLNPPSSPTSTVPHRTRQRFLFRGPAVRHADDDDDYWLDLLFFHRRLRCLVAIDLKIGRSRRR